jgi:hypothetical protein
MCPIPHNSNVATTAMMGFTVRRDVQRGGNGGEIQTPEPFAGKFEKSGSA